MRQVSLTNTLGGKLQILQPLIPPQVSIYTCGPTVYGDQHIGNYRTFIFEDVLVKMIRQFGYDVKRIMNITDVGHLTSDSDDGEDKLEIGAKRDGITAWDVARRYEKRFIEDLDKLNIQLPQLFVRATDTIDAQIKFIQSLEEKGYTYKTSDGVYFETSKLSDYGKLAQLDIAGLQAGARVDMGEKHSATDFALWKFSPADHQRDMEWESPWGKGFPGWHIECSAIIKETLGDQIDIHCGGVDHIPIHHTNEIAQTETLTGKPMASIWLHADFLTVDGGKMAKSLGNLYTVNDIEQANLDPLALRLFVYSAHYRSKLNFTWEAFESAHKALSRLRRLFAAPDKGEETNTSALEEQFAAALANDLNTAEAIAVLFKIATANLKQSARQAAMLKCDEILGLGLAQVADAVVVTEEAKTLLASRKLARQEKNWVEADRLRVVLEDMGYTVTDSAADTVLS